MLQSTNLTSDTQSLRFAAQAALELGKREQEERWKASPWDWIQDRATLLDPLAVGNQVAPFPDFPYLKAFINEINTHNAIICWKSRRMVASWSALTYAVWMATLHKNQRIFLISRKEGDNDSEGVRELVWRCKWIVDHLRNGPPVAYEGGKLYVQFETGSTITGISSEPNAMRAVSANFVIADEFAFYDKPRDSYAALKPTLEARGKFLGISSTSGGFFKQIVRDEIEEGGGAARGGILSIPGQGVLLPSGHTDDSVEEGAPRLIEKRVGTPAQVIPGYAAWTNKGNKFRVVAIHYTADPRKRNPEWKKREQEGMPLSLWLAEYEMCFDVASGRPVYLHEWRPQVMLVSGIKTEKTRPILVGLDFGYHHPAMIAAQMRYAQQLCILRALQGSQVRFEDWMNEVISQLKTWFPTRSIEDPNDFVWCCDAAGDQEHGTGASEIKILRRTFGLRPKFKKVRIPPTIDMVRGYMSRTYRGEPCFLVDDNPSTSIVVDGLNGGYAYPQGEINEDTTPSKDGLHDHTQDVLRYLAVNFGTNPGRSLNRAAFDLAARSDILERKVYAY